MNKEITESDIDQWIELIAPRIAKKFSPCVSLEEIEKQLSTNMVLDAHREVQSLAAEMIDQETDRSKIMLPVLKKNIYDTINSENE